jgi:hypothetical protein
MGYNDDRDDVTQADADAAYARLMHSSLVSNLDKNALTLMHKQASWEHNNTSGQVENLTQAYHIAKHGMQSKDYNIQGIDGEQISLQSGTTKFIELYQRNTQYRPDETMRRLISTPSRA